MILFPDGLALVGKVERPGFLAASEEHECMRPVGFDHKVVRKERMDTLGDSQCLRELSCKQGVPCHNGERLGRFLAWLYQNGQGVAQDYAKAREWFEKAAAKGNEEAPIVAALFAREFTKALALADRARSLSPDDLMFESYRAHALMFLERGEEAKALYLAHKGEPVSGLDGKPWERVIVGAFSDLREAGLTHPMMAEIEKELGVSP